MIRANKHTSSLSSSDLRAIVAAASTIAERISGNFLIDDTPASAELRQQRLDAWCRMSAGGDSERFRSILAWDGHTIADVQRVLGHVYLDEQAPLPEWTVILQEALQLGETQSDEHGTLDKSSWSFLVPDEPCPFEELLAPFVVVARQRVARQTGSASSLLSDEAHDMLQRHLLQVLTSLSLNTLHAAFLRHRSRQPVPAGEQPVNDIDAYQHFITWMYQGGLVAFLHEYSFLARLLATTTQHWIEAQIEFLQRLENDWQDIHRVWSGDPEREQIIALEPALSNPHRGGRSVMVLTFASGEKLVYKPRPIGMEVGYYHLLNWCNEHGATPRLQILATLDRSTYGWMEFAGHEPCQDGEAARRYYQRAGMLLCLVYVLGGIGCSYEHSIAHGEHPVLLDPSVLLHHYPCPDHQEDPQQKQCSDWEHRYFSVLHTGLLTTRQINAETAWWRPGRDISSFTLNDVQNMPDHAQPREHRSLPAFKYGMLRVREYLNLPAYESNLLSLSERQTALCAGFTALYQLLLRERGALLAADSPLQILKQQTVRVTYRTDQAYHIHLAKFLEPAYMRDGVARSIVMERLWQEPVPVEYKCWQEGNGARWRQVYQAEQQDLLQGDIPFFTAQVDSNILFANRAIASCLHQPSFDLLLKRVEHLSQSDLSKQIKLIQHVLRTHTARLPGHTTCKTSTHATPAQDQTPAQDVLLAHARTIAETIAEQAIPLEDATVTWIEPQFLRHSSRRQLQPVRSGLFHGSSGIALFLAAFARISGEARYHTLARAAVRSLCQSLREDGEMLVREMGIGGAVGLGSVVYALTRISHLIDDPALLEAAREAAHLLQARHIANDQALDVIAGSAGTILGLLALYDASRDQGVLDLAITCGEHLLQARTMSRANCLAWPTLGQMHTTGFSHGTAGIVYALMRLYAVTGDSELLNAAREGLSYEDHAFVSSAGNWAEMLTNEEPIFMATWCHGAPGIGLARIGGLAGLDTGRIRQDIEIALQTTRHVDGADPDHLCCGNSGRVEILLTAAQKLARPELADAAKHIMWSTLTRAEQKGHFLLDITFPNQAPPMNLFHGTSGIGYTLLRLAYPDQLPSLLLWE